jgi:preprotein translocase subunit SecA
MFQNILKTLGMDPNKREVQTLAEIVDRINLLEEDLEKLSDEALCAKTPDFRRRLAAGETLDDILPEAFATVREASKRTIGLRHYDVQMIGGMTLHKGKIAEMRTGEGKTLVATLPLYLNALAGRGVHLVTVNDYLARRDARWMGAIFHFLGMQVGVLQMAARTDNGKNAFLIDFERTSPHEDQHNLRLVLRDEAYKADITYGTNAEFGFDYLRDNLTMTLEERVQRGHYFAIVDEVDNILIDEARTPLIISGPAADESEWYLRLSQVVRQLNPEDYEINERDRSVSMTEIGEVHVEEILGLPLKDPDRPEDITPEQARILGYLEQALRAQFLFKRNKDYLVQAGKVVIVDEFTGRLMPGRRWSEGLHQAIEAKEGVKVEPENVTYATITLQNYYRMYEKLAGMTGTASTEAEEFHKIYKLDVLSIPTNLEYQAFRKDAELVEVSKKDKQGYRFNYYTRKNDINQVPLFWRRQDYPDSVYRSEEGKLRAITQELMYYYIKGRPLLIGTTSVEHSERLADRIQAEPLRRLCQVLLIRRTYQDKNNIELFERAVPELEILNKPISDLDISEMRPLARSLDMSLNVEDPINLEKLSRIMGLDEEDRPRLIKALQGGVSHNVLNARKHDEESQIIARAGAFGSVTIATNMAGRGVDIKLGGELPEEILKDTNRVLGRVDEDPYDMTLEERRRALQALPVEQYGIYEESVKTFLQYIEEMEKVRDLGGLHVIGSERHEARRIDNQLRGRAARQGDPGSSRFYLSLEDDLMRLFGGPQVESLWKRMFFDESLPLEMNLLGRLVEQSQGRVEGSNFDVRKHLLEYDDVLNSQRKRIYSQRDRVFTKENLSEDVLDMLRTELQQRIPQALKDEEGPWKLLAYLDEIQPGFGYEDIVQLSFPLRLIRDEIRSRIKTSSPSSAELRGVLLSIAEQALQAEKEHLMRSTRELLDRNTDTLETQLNERSEALETFVESLPAGDENGQPLRSQDILTQLGEAVRLPIRLTPEQLRRLPDGDKGVMVDIRQQIEATLNSMLVSRLIGAFERRLEEELGLRPQQFAGLPWKDVLKQLADAVEDTFNKRMNRLLGPDGQLAGDLDAYFSRTPITEVNDQAVMQVLVMLSQGSRLAFDARTHRKGTRQVTRLNYHFLAAQIIDITSAKDITEQVLQHLEESLVKLEAIRGQVEWVRLMQSEVTLQMLDEKARQIISNQLGTASFDALAAQPLTEYSPQDRQVVTESLGRYLQNELYRFILLRVISDQWVEYLTKVEALRVSIGLEAYAQRDPLVQYKTQATEMFQVLLADIRMGVVSRIFTSQVRRGPNVEQNQQTGEQPPQQTQQAAAQSANSDESGTDRKKKRHRH